MHHGNGWCVCMLGLLMKKLISVLTLLLLACSAPQENLGFAQDQHPSVAALKEGKPSAEALSLLNTKVGVINQTTANYTTECRIYTDKDHRFVWEGNGTTLFDYESNRGICNVNQKGSYQGKGVDFASRFTYDLNSRTGILTKGGSTFVYNGLSLSSIRCDFSLASQFAHMSDRQQTEISSTIEGSFMQGSLYYAAILSGKGLYALAREEWTYSSGVTSLLDQSYFFGQRNEEYVLQAYSCFTKQSAPIDGKTCFAETLFHAKFGYEKQTVEEFAAPAEDAQNKEPITYTKSTFFVSAMGNVNALFSGDDKAKKTYASFLPVWYGSTLPIEKSPIPQGDPGHVLFYEDGSLSGMERIMNRIAT